MGKGIVVSPHHLASQAGAEILRQGGNAIEAAIAVASTLCVVYPHMTGMGGDSFWLLSRGGDEVPTFIDACGYAGEKVSKDALEVATLKEVPTRGPWSALTMAGAVDSWSKALDICKIWKGDKASCLDLNDLFAEAIRLGKEGFPVTKLLNSMLEDNFDALREQEYFGENFFIDGRAPKMGETLRLPLLSRTFEALARDGLDSFYRGAMAKDMAKDLDKLGCPLTLKDFNEYEAEVKPALSLKTHQGYFYNSNPPTQGVASLLIVGQLLHLYASGRLNPAVEADNLHALVEATKNAFILRNEHITDPSNMRIDVKDWLKEDFVKELSDKISMEKAAPWPMKSQPGDTVWFGVIDDDGKAVSCIQSIYHEFGSGMVLPSTGMIWHNRALGFSLDEKHPNFLKARKKPFHTLNPAMARLNDGRFLSYGTMGGEGQPQTQGAMIYRYLGQGLSPQDTVKAPRWLLGRTWGGASDNLKLESDFPQSTLDSLKKRGHDMEIVDAQSSLMGHAGLLVRHPDGSLEGGVDSRSDGSVERA